MLVCLVGKTVSFSELSTLSLKPCLEVVGWGCSLRGEEHAGDLHDRHFPIHPKTTGTNLFYPFPYRIVLVNRRLLLSNATSSYLVRFFQVRSWG